MHAVTVVNGELRWEQHRDPVAGDTELLVAVRAAGVNAADLNQRRGLYPTPHGVADDIPGLELAGEVLDIGRQVTRFAVGDRIMAIVGGGAHATLATVDEMHASGSHRVSAGLRPADSPRRSRPHMTRCGARLA